MQARWDEFSAAYLPACCQVNSSHRCDYDLLLVLSHPLWHERPPLPATPPIALTTAAEYESVIVSRLRAEDFW